MKQAPNWFEDWFDTPYYHMLYRHRDEQEAEQLIQNLINRLEPGPDYELLDVACGRGRHAIFLNSLGFKVTGIDLSSANITYAKQFENERLHFFQQDMRKPYGEAQYDCIFNLFTSFGYFGDWEENQQAANCMAQALKPGGTLILDFMNVKKVIPGLIKEAQCELDGILFHINKHVQDDCLIKQISFQHKGMDFKYEEKVQLFELPDFKHLLGKAGLNIGEVYGDFELRPFDERNSERLLLFAQHS